jgi:hypothetical protein
MGTTPPQHTGIGVDDYLAGELQSEVRHEYVAGQVYAMVGASDRHGLIARHENSSNGIPISGRAWLMYWSCWSETLLTRHFGYTR